MKPQELIEKFKMERHPEGGYYKETYRSTTTVGNRSVSTGIYFLLPEGAKSHLHRIKSDEMWHFYLGDPLKICEIRPDGTIVETILGNSLYEGQQVQYVVPAGSWFGALPLGKYSFVGCTVAPGFDFADFELGDRKSLLTAFPKAEATIKSLT